MCDQHDRRLMRTLISRISLLLSATILLLVFTSSSAAANPLATGDFQRSTLVIETTDNKRYEFQTYLAEKPKQLQQGLMFVRSLPNNTGMLFDFNPPKQVAMWMKNTLISLDMLFIDSSGVILNIAADTTPGSLDTLRSSGVARAVLEINGGMAAKLGIEPGDRVIHPWFENG